MNSIGTATIVKQKAQVEKAFEIDVPVCLYGPREDNNGNMYVCSYAGEILRFEDGGSYQVFLTIGGQPNCMINL